MADEQKHILDRAMSALVGVLNDCIGHYRIGPKGKPEMCSRTAVRAVIEAMRVPPEEDTEVWSCPCCSQIVDRASMAIAKPIF